MVSVNLEPCLSFANTAWGTDPQQWPPRALSRATAAEWSKGACTLALQPHQGGGSSWPLGKSPFIMLLVSGEVSSSCHPSLLAVVVHSLHLRSYITAWCILPGPDLVKAFLAPGAAKGIYPNRVGLQSLGREGRWPHLLGRSCWRRELVPSDRAALRPFLFPPRVFFVSVYPPSLLYLAFIP